MDLASAGVSGLCIIGRFDGLDQGRSNSPALLLRFEYESREGRKAGRRAVEFVGYNAGTGEQLPLGRQVAECQPGDLVAVNVWADAHPGGVARETGKRYEPFVTYRAVSVTRLAPAGAVDHLVSAFPGTEVVSSDGAS